LTHTVEQPKFRLHFRLSYFIYIREHFSFCNEEF